MNNNRNSEYIVKKNNTAGNSIVSNFFLLIKQFFYCFFRSIVFSLVVIITANAAYKTEKTANDHLTFFNFLMQHGDLPVEYLDSLYIANASLQNELPEEIAYPVFSVLEVEKKFPLARRLVHSYTAHTDLNHFVSYFEGIEYINQKRMTQLKTTPLFSWLLKEYGSCYYQSESDTTVLLTITIGGMLYDIKCRAENDPVAKLVLEFLNHPYVKSTHAASTDKQFFLTKYTHYLSQLFSFQPTELSFSERLGLLKDSPCTQEENRQKRLFKLKKQGYSYKKDYIFISYELDENGDKKPIYSDSIILPVKKSQKLLDADYPILKRSDNKSITVNGLKIAALFTAGLSLLPAANAYIPSTTSSSQCSITDGCSPQDYQLLSNGNFASALQKNATGCFQLTENITLNTQHNLPVFPTCDNSFSGILKTGDYAIHSGNNNNTLFGCINKAKITGNFNLCVDDPVHNPPVIAGQALHENILTVQQTDNCKTQYPMLGNITGDYNQVTFTGVPGEARTTNDAGVIATHISGDHNIIRAQKSHLFDTPVVSIAGGRNNTYYQQDMKITRFTKGKLPDNKLLVADSFTGNQTTVVQQNIDAKFLTSGTHIPNQNAIGIKNGTVNTFTIDSSVTVNPPETIRITNTSDNHLQRSVIKNHGRFEIFRDDKWQAVCESTLNQKTAHAACKSLGYKEAKDEGTRIALRNVLPVNKLQSNPIHINRECTGYERHLEQCNIANATISGCPGNMEAVLSCSHDIARSPTFVRLTDYTSNHPDRFDTTNTGTGRIEHHNGKTVCSHGFTSMDAQVACYSMGFNGGEKIYLQQAPLSKAISQLGFQWNCLGNETELLSCPTYNFNLNDYNCTHQNDVILKCNTRPLSLDVVNFRLTDRHSISESRANLSSTGFGRLEMLVNNNSSEYVSFCDENVDSQLVEIICNKFGFDSGRKFYSTADPLLPIAGFDGEDGRGRRLLCANNNITNCTTTEGFFEECSRPYMNSVLWCTNLEDSRNNISLVENICPEMQTTTILVSGSYNLISNCKDNYCPVRLWDADRTTVSDDFYKLCNGTQQLHTIRSEDWLAMWNHRCSAKTDNCDSCHLPGEQTLRIVADNHQPNGVLLISHQTYSDNTEPLNTQELILINRPYSAEAPQILRSVDQNLITGARPVNYIITEQQLMGLYSINNTNTQLFWSSLEHSNGVYHTQTLPVNGKPLLLTDNSIFVQERNSSTIKQYALSRTTNNNVVMFNIDDSVYEDITLPETISDVFAATLKNDQLSLAATLTHDKVYSAATDENSVKQIYLVHYDIIKKTWSYTTEAAHNVTSDNIYDHSLFIDDNSQIRFLSNKYVSIPK
ncbi:MAG: scavenger receptor cysteine-rich domain-containing protein, partial [Endozoicomonadaceae bacterium]|nr:scavenger receptor cysteine-rich domain-containing protein [Endozoicomonadaceae bacterium]